MSRCPKTRTLEVHHRSRTGGAGISNAVVLCQKCHENTPTYGKLGISPPSFSQSIKEEALKNSGNRCECRRINCHD